MEGTCGWCPVMRDTTLVTGELNAYCTALKSPTPCPLVLHVLHSVSITTTDRLTLIVLRTTRYSKHSAWAECSEEISLLRFSAGLRYSNGTFVITVTNLKIPLQGVLLYSYRGTASWCETSPCVQNVTVYRSDIK